MSKKRKSNTKANKIALVKRDGRYCPRCGEPLAVPGFPFIKGDRTVLVHHIQPVSTGGSDDISNLMLSCIPCESAYHGITDTLHMVRNRALTKLHKYPTALINPNHPDFRVKQCAKDIVVMVDHLKLDPRPTRKEAFLWWLQHQIIKRLAK